VEVVNTPFEQLAVEQDRHGAANLLDEAIGVGVDDPTNVGPSERESVGEGDQAHEGSRGCNGVAVGPDEAGVRIGTVNSLDEVGVGRHLENPRGVGRVGIGVGIGAGNGGDQPPLGEWIAAGGRCPDRVMG